MVPDLFMIPVVLSPMNMQVMTLMTSLFRVMRGTSVREGGEIEQRREHKAREGLYQEFIKDNYKSIRKGYIHRIGGRALYSKDA